MPVIGISAQLDQAAYSSVNDPTGRSLLIAPKGYRPDATVTGVIFAHGATGTEQDIWSSASTNIMNIMKTVALYYPVLSCNFGGDLWGNDTSILQMADALTYLQGTKGAKAGKVILMGRSMGHLTVANWARQHPTSVAAIAVFAGVSDLANIYAQAGSTASIDTAYSTYNPATMAATHDPNVYAGNHDLDGIPWRNYYATDDTTVSAATVTTLAGKITTGTAISMGTGGHTDTPLANIDLPALLTWLATYATPFV